MATIDSDALSPVMSSNEDGEGSLLANTESKKRNKLGYHRTAVACAHCRRRKIRCIPATEPALNRCQNCVRLKKECQYLPVDQNIISRKGHAPSRLENESNEVDLSAGSSSPIATQVALERMSEDESTGSSAHIHSWLNHTTLRAANVDGTPFMPMPELHEGEWHTPPLAGPPSGFRSHNLAQPELETNNLWLTQAEAQGRYMNSSFLSPDTPASGAVYQEPQFAYDASSFDKQRYASIRQSYHGGPMYESVPQPTFADPVALESQRRMTMPAMMYIHHSGISTTNPNMNGVHDHGIAPAYHANTFNTFHTQGPLPYANSLDQREAQPRYFRSHHARAPDFTPNPG